MPTKSELQYQLKRLRQELKKNRELMMKAAVNAEELFIVQGECERLHYEVRELKRTRKHPK